MVQASTHSHTIPRLGSRIGAFYHGLLDDGSPDNERIYPVEVGMANVPPARYRLVYLNSCASAMNAAGGDWKQNFRAECVVGWKNVVYSDIAPVFDVAFWGEIKKGRTAKQATTFAAAACNLPLGHALPVCNGNVTLPNHSER
jgi:hypothetical protein